MKEISEISVKIVPTYFIMKGGKEEREIRISVIFNGSLYLKVQPIGNSLFWTAVLRLREGK
jgi:hypothetical protein